MITKVKAPPVVFIQVENVRETRKKWARRSIYDFCIFYGCDYFRKGDVIALLSLGSALDGYYKITGIYRNPDGRLPNNYGATVRSMLSIKRNYGPTILNANLAYVTHSVTSEK